MKSFLAPMEMQSGLALGVLCTHTLTKRLLH
jgi:hypothetical protein